MQNNRKDRKKNVEKIAIGLLIIFAIAFWGKEINSGFFADDFKEFLPYFDRVKDLNFFSVVRNLFSGQLGSYYRPFSDFAYYLTFFFFGNDPTGYMVIRIFAHILSSAMIFWLVMLIFKDRFLSLFSASLFCFFFRHFVGVKWISQSWVVTPLILLSIIMYVYFKNSNKKLYYVISTLAFSLALLSQENTAILPFFILLIYIFMECKFDISRLNFRWNLKPLLFVGLYFFITLFYFFLINAFHLEREIGSFNPIIQDFFNLGYFSAGFLIPFSVGKLKWSLHQFLDNGEWTPLLKTLFLENWILVLISIGIGCFIVFIVYHWRLYRSELFGLLWICIALVPFIPFVGNANRYFYIPSVGFCIVISMLLNRIKRRRLKYGLCLLVLAFNISILSIELKYWNHKYRQQVKISQYFKKNYPDLKGYNIVFWEDRDTIDLLKKLPIKRYRKTFQYLQMERSKYIEYPALLEISGYITEYLRWLYKDPSIEVGRVDLDTSREDMKKMISENGFRYIWLKYDGKVITQGSFDLTE